MHLQNLLVVFALSLTVFCSTNGAPVTGAEGEGGEPGHSSTRASTFSSQEDEFIINEVLIQTEEGRNLSWQIIEKKHEREVNKKAYGFGRKRSADSIRVHFHRQLRNKISGWKPKETLHKHKYTEQEEEFINKELASESFRDVPLHAARIWKEIAEKHKLKREQQCEGFSKERSSRGLMEHFRVSMRPGGRETDEVKNRFPHSSKINQEGASTSNKQLGKQLLFDLNAAPDEAGSDDE